MRDLFACKLTRALRLACGCLAILSGVSLAETHPLDNTSWQLVEFQSMSDEVGVRRPQNPKLYQLNFNPDGKVNLHLNCNRANGGWSGTASSDGNSGELRFGMLGMTRALCPRPSMDGFIAAQLQHVRSYLRKDDKLYLSLMADGGIIVWQGDNPSAQAKVAPEQGGPRNWQVTVQSGGLNLRAYPSLNASVVSNYPHNTLLDNLGCQSAEGRIWCDVQQLGGGPRGFVASEYLRGAVSPDGSVATGPDDSALRAGQGQFDATGNVPCRLSASEALQQCAFAVARAGGGYATVVIDAAPGTQRTFYFRIGQAIGFSSSEAEGYPPFNASKQGDQHHIQLGEEHYQIPDAVILGG